MTFKKFDLEECRAAIVAIPLDSATAIVASPQKCSGASDNSGHVVSQPEKFPLKCSDPSGLPQKNKVSRIGDIEYQLPVSTQELLAIPLRPCVWCAHFTFHDYYCAARDWTLAEPTRQCRCVWYRARGFDT